MAKTEKELDELKKKVEDLNTELKELSDDELSLVAGGIVDPPDVDIYKPMNGDIIDYC